MKSADLVEGQDYAFKPSTRSSGPLVRVKLLDALPVATKVGVRFETGERAGEEGQVSLGQLIVPWEQADALEAEEASFQRLAAGVPDRDHLHQRAVEMVCQWFSRIEDVEAVQGGIVIEAEALQALVTEAGIELSQVTDHELAFETRSGALVIPMRPAEEMARAIVTKRAADLVQEIIEWERDYPSTYRYEREALRTIRSWAKVPDRPSPEEIAQTEEVRRATLAAIGRLEQMSREAQNAADELRARLGL